MFLNVHWKNLVKECRSGFPLLLSSLSNFEFLFLHSEVLWFRFGVLSLAKPIVHAYKKPRSLIFRMVEILAKALHGVLIFAFLKICENNMRTLAYSPAKRDTNCGTHHTPPQCQPNSFSVRLRYRTLADAK